MAVVVTIAKGYDLGYIWKTQDHAAERTTGGYYLNAAQAGEPPGRWWGPGAQALGLAPGQVVERAPYDAVYRQTDPRNGARLGRPRGRYPTFADHLARLQAAEPHATAERLIELEREAARATRQPAAYYDVTVSFSKSISVLHASLRENERRARLAGDQQAAAYWAGREQAFQEVLHRANRAALEYAQAWAGITRTGYHGTRIDGREPGRFEPAGLIVTSWLQGTSRDGVRAMSDGRLWLLRDAYAAETAWAPRHAGKELRLARLGAFDAILGAIRANAEADAARKAGDHDRASRHECLAASYRAMRDHYQQQEQAPAQAMADRQDWEHATTSSRQLAIAADAELRRRYPDRKIERCARRSQPRSTTLNAATRT